MKGYVTIYNLVARLWKKVKFFFLKEIKIKNENVKIYYLFYFFRKKEITFLGNILYYGVVNHAGSVIGKKPLDYDSKTA